MNYLKKNFRIFFLVDVVCVNLTDYLKDNKNKKCKIYENDRVNFNLNAINKNFKEPKHKLKH